MTRKQLIRKYKATAGDMAVEIRQIKLAENSEAIERWHRKLFRAANELKKLTEQRKRLLYPRKPTDKLKEFPMTGMGGGAVDADMNDEIPL